MAKIAYLCYPFPDEEEDSEPILQLKMPSMYQFKKVVRVVWFELEGDYEHNI